MIDEKFAKYVLGELFWEMEQFGLSLVGAEHIPRDSIEVLSCSINQLRIRANGLIFEAQLCWSADAAPTITLME